MGTDTTRQHLLDLSQDFNVEGRRLHPHPCIITVGPPNSALDCPSVEESTFTSAGPCRSIWGLFNYSKCEEVKLFGCATRDGQHRLRDLATAAWDEVGGLIPILLPSPRLSAEEYANAPPWVRWLLLCFDVAWSSFRPPQLTAVQTGWFTCGNGIMQTITTGDLDALAAEARIAYCRDLGIDPERLPKHFYAELKPDAFRASALVAEVLAHRLPPEAAACPTDLVPLVRASELAEVSDKTVGRWIKDGKLPVYGPKLLPSQAELLAKLPQLRQRRHR